MINKQRLTKFYIKMFLIMGISMLSYIAGTKQDTRVISSVGVVTLTFVWALFESQVRTPRS